MIETFCALLLAHALADFVFQTKYMVAHKRAPHIFALHILIVFVTAVAATGSQNIAPIAMLAAAHLIIDAIKTYALRINGLWPFLTDQAAHLITITIAALFAPTLWAQGVWAGQSWLPALMTAVAGILIATRAGGFAVGFLMAPLTSPALPKGLTNGGHLIGILERGLVFLLVMVGQPAGIGFLIAAKSVLRFDATTKANADGEKDQSAGEYVIIGTLASFGWALVVSYATVALMSHLPPLGILPPAP